MFDACEISLKFSQMHRQMRWKCIQKEICKCHRMRRKKKSYRIMYSYDSAHSSISAWNSAESAKTNKSIAMKRNEKLRCLITLMMWFSDSLTFSVRAPWIDLILFWLLLPKDYAILSTRNKHFEWDNVAGGHDTKTNHIKKNANKYADRNLCFISLTVKVSSLWLNRAPLIPFAFIVYT